MAQILGLPKLSPTMEEGVLVRWTKKEGDKVAAWRSDRRGRDRQGEHGLQRRGRRRPVEAARGGGRDGEARGAGRDHRQGRGGCRARSSLAARPKPGRAGRAGGSGGKPEAKAEPAESRRRRRRRPRLPRLLRLPRTPKSFCRRPDPAEPAGRPPTVAPPPGGKLLASPLAKSSRGRVPRRRPAAR